MTPYFRRLLVIAALIFSFISFSTSTQAGDYNRNLLCDSLLLTAGNAVGYSLMGGVLSSVINLTPLIATNTSLLDSAIHGAQTGLMISLGLSSVTIINYLLFMATGTTTTEEEAEEQSTLKEILDTSLILNLSLSVPGIYALNEFCPEEPEE